MVHVASTPSFLNDLSLPKFCTAQFRDNNAELFRHLQSDSTFVLHKSIEASHLIIGGRDVIVMLPREAISEPNRRFPVALMLDGENLFDTPWSPQNRHTWQIGSTCRNLINQGLMEPVIIVGVCNSPKSREPDLTPFPHS